MPYPPPVEYEGVEEYREHFVRVYCRGPIATFDGIAVRFRKAMFHHAFLERSVRRGGPKDTFSVDRARRIDWIAAALQDPGADLFVGWDSLHKRYTPDRRVALVKGDYVVVISLVGAGRADFVTAFIADTPATLNRIRQGPRWARK